MKPKDYWGEDPTYPVEDWQYEVRNGDTRLGYWEWVNSMVESNKSAPAPKKRGRKSKLTPELCKEIYESYYGSSMNQTNVARLYKVSDTTVANAIKKHAQTLRDAKGK